MSKLGALLNKPPDGGSYPFFLLLLPCSGINRGKNYKVDTDAFFVGVKPWGLRKPFLRDGDVGKKK